MSGAFYINNKNTKTNWGVVLADSGMAALLAPAPKKEYVTNTSRLISGLIPNTSFVPKKDSRDIQLEVYLIASSWTDFLTKLASFYAELDLGFVNVKTDYQPSVVYHCIYRSCAQFTELDGRLAKFSLRLTELNPDNRTA